MSLCNHENVRCLNHFELIRKYVCLKCGTVMMCSCDESIGRSFLPHQLTHGTELETQQHIPVTGGFQLAICHDCRGLPPEAYPVASLPGQTSKVRRYYWREIAFRNMELYAERAKAHGLAPEDTYNPKTVAAREKIEEQVLQEIKHLHNTTPKYTYHEQSQSEIIQQYNVEVVDIKGTYQKTEKGEKAKILDAGEAIPPEEFVCRYFSRLGYQTIFVESTPFHVLFGLYMWLVIQDHTDPHVQFRGFGDRASFEVGLQSRMIWTPLPDDFGTPGYGKRRALAIQKHISPHMRDRDELKWLFSYWLPYSEPLREYLWAHRKEDIETARQLIQILPPEIICEILKYLTDSYWARYCGWPDLLIYKQNEYFFAEVKSSSDKLSEDQKRWIQDNDMILKLPFKLIKIHKDKLIRKAYTVMT